MADWDKTLPDGTQPLRVGDDVIRGNNDALESRLAVEHNFPDNSDANRQGRHKFGTGDDTARDTAITSPASGMLWARSDIPVWELHNGTIWVGKHGAYRDTLANRDALTDLSDGQVAVVTDADERLSVQNADGAPSFAWLVAAGIHSFATVSTTDKTACGTSWTKLQDTAGTADVQVQVVTPASGPVFLVLGFNAISIEESSGAAASTNLRFELDDGTTTTTVDAYHANIGGTEFSYGVGITIPWDSAVADKTYTIKIEGHAGNAGTMTFNETGSGVLGVPVTFSSTLWAAVVAKRS